MVQLTPAGLFAAVALGCFIAVATPAYALFFSLGWGWRLWIAGTSHVMSFALYQQLSLPARRYSGR